MQAFLLPSLLLLIRNALYTLLISSPTVLELESLLSICKPTRASSRWEINMGETWQPFICQAFCYDHFAWGISTLSGGTAKAQDWLYSFDSLQPIVLIGMMIPDKVSSPIPQHSSIASVLMVNCLQHPDSSVVHSQPSLISGRFLWRIITWLWLYFPSANTVLLSCCHVISFPNKVYSFPSLSFPRTFLTFLNTRQTLLRETPNHCLEKYIGYYY